MPSSRGFDKSKVVSDIPNTLPGGSTAMVEGLYRGWDELRSVPSGQQSGLRVIVLFTDGASNSVPGLYDVAPGSAKGLRTADFPKNYPDPDNQTHDHPGDRGPLRHADRDSSEPAQLQHQRAPPLVQHDDAAAGAVPAAQSFHAHRRSAGIPSSFPLQSPTLTVKGVAQSIKRGLRNRKPNRRTPPTSGTSTMRRGTWSRSSPTPRAATTATTASASTRSAWANWCVWTSGRCRRSPRRS